MSESRGCQQAHRDAGAVPRPFGETRNAGGTKGTSGTRFPIILKGKSPPGSTAVRDQDGQQGGREEGPDYSTDVLRPCEGGGVEQGTSTEGRNTLEDPTKQVHIMGLGRNDSFKQTFSM